MFILALLKCDVFTDFSHIYQIMYLFILILIHSSQFCFLSNLCTLYTLLLFVFFITIWLLQCFLRRGVAVVWGCLDSSFGCLRESEVKDSPLTAMAHGSSELSHSYIPFCVCVTVRDVCIFVLIFVVVAVGG